MHTINGLAFNKRTHFAIARRDEIFNGRILAFSDLTIWLFNDVTQKYDAIMRRDVTRIEYVN